MPSQGFLKIALSKLPLRTIEKYLLVGHMDMLDGPHVARGPDIAHLCYKLTMPFRDKSSSDRDTKIGSLKTNLNTERPNAYI